MIVAGLDLVRAEPAGTTVTKVLASGRSLSVATVVAEATRVLRRHPRLATRRAPGSQVRDLRLRSVVWPDLDAIARTPLPAGLRATADDVAARTRSNGSQPTLRTPRMSRPSRGDLVWLGIALGCVWLAWLYPLLLDPRHYFQGDTQNAYYGWFHHLGDGVLHGRWPMLDAQAGSAGNPLAEGQEGLYSPLSWLIGMGAAVAPQVVVYATLVKLVIAAIAVTGCYLLARGYSVRPGLAAVAAVAAPAGRVHLVRGRPALGGRTAGGCAVAMGVVGGPPDGGRREPVAAPCLDVPARHHWLRLRDDVPRPRGRRAVDRGTAHP